ncbi:CheR family methyltransferase [Aquabacterium sp.]|uniref:CheR family methyltransferase n=1 Tax=Aquabacterium sp. TaxID=1872578 RepID=UPI002C6AD5A3|nr:protein-glutamate O-methyltransferase CheR [Aquabacterium sp.]HSW07173.1 protein-glutamate O-methyltransferase CheR [Aquabacterium sp.]
MHTLRDDTFRQIGGLMHAAIGLSFPDSKKPLMLSRLSPRLRHLGLDSFEDYAALIRSADDGGEFQMAVDLLTTNETYFFREPAHFDLLAREIGQARQRAPQVWSAAASFGDEAWSVAMLLADLQQQGRVDSGWSILATDISDRVLRSAQRAIYPQERLRHVTPERLRRHCLRGEGESAGLVQIHPRLQGKLRFGQLNLCQAIEPLGPFDIIFLRNVLIYFDAPTKAAVVDRVLEQLRPGGLLFIGTAEGRVPCRTPLQVIAPGAFRKTGVR